ncbi:MAG: helix-turn-helix domain-containing protein [Woeseiaceae bacterium]
MQVTKFVESYFDAWNHADPEGVAEHLTKDGVYQDIPVHAESSHDNLISYLSRFFASNHHRYELIGDILTNGNTVAFEYKSTLTDPVCKSELPASYCGAEFMTLLGEAAITITDYYDTGGTNQSANISNIGEQSAGKYAKSGLNETQLLEYKQRLETIMQVDQLYLHSDMTLPKLADAVGCSVNHLSQVINAGFGMSFFDYLNRYRIQYAREMLSALDDRNCAILNIAFTVGFNSNSAFYAAFKKCVGQTPAQYRRSQLKKSH